MLGTRLEERRRKKKKKKNTREETGLKIVIRRRESVSFRDNRVKIVAKK